MNPNPQDGGSYRRNADGSLTLLSPTTGERPCKCRPNAAAEANLPATKPAAPASPLVGLAAIADAHDAAEATAEVEPTTRRTKRKE